MIETEEIADVDVDVEDTASPCARAVDLIPGDARADSGEPDPWELLLQALSGVLDIRQVFPRVSEIAARVLPHDRLTMSFHDPAGNIVIEAASNDDGPPGDRFTLKKPTAVSDGSVAIVGDFTIETPPAMKPDDLHQRIVEAGYRSMLAVHFSARDQGIGLQFWSKTAHAFAPRHAGTARRVAHHVALAISHEQLADAARQVAEAHARAERLQARVTLLSRALESQTGYGRVIGRSDEWMAVLKRSTQVAATDTTVLVTGESGTGKEVVARFIHRASTRAGGPYIAINCAALPDQLLESEIFGHERGAFTGAQQAKPGQIELAAGGTFFLDEVAEMSPAVQAKFLRVLQEREFQRLGGTRMLKANIRVIAATNRDLRKAVERGDFREDLYYRLCVFDIQVPALRDRTADILPLAETFLEDLGRSFGRPPAGLTRDARSALLDYRWPGNVRELRNALERAAILSDGELIAPAHLALPIDEPGPSPQPAQLTPAAPVATTDLHRVESEMIERVLREAGDNKSKAARRLGLTRTQLYVRLRKYGIAASAANG